MKKRLLIIPLLCLLLSLTGCRADTPPGASAAESPAETPADSAAESHAENTADSTADEPADKPEGSAAGRPSVSAAPVTPTPAPVDPDTVFYFSNALEMNRIYRQGLDGSDLTLICDTDAHSVEEMGQLLYIIDRNGVLCRCPSDGGPAETVFADFPVFRLHKVDDISLAFVCYGEDESGFANRTYLYRHDVQSGRTSRVADGLSGITLAADGKVIYALTNAVSGDMDYHCYDFGTGESRFCDGLRGNTVFARGNDVYGYQADDSGNMSWYRYDLASMRCADIDLNVSDFDQVLGFDGKNLLVWNETEIYRVTGQDRTLVCSFAEESGTWILPVTQKKGIVIVSVARDKTAQVFDDTEYYQEWDYYAVSFSAGEVKKITAEGEAGKLFADGSFPQLDVSTARKPLAADLCSLFFRGYGWEGAEPMNHKSHGAWLNLADGGCDLILVPAPAEEEKAYLAEKGVEAEMKVFGADGLVFISGTGSGVTGLTLEELRAIYRGEITNWKELGGADHAITVFYRNDLSGSQRQFEKLVWNGETIPDFEALGFSIMDDMISIVRQCQSDPYAIGYSIMTYLTDVFGNRDVCLMGIDGVTPSLETVTDMTYPLTLHDYVAIRADEPEGSPARRLYDWFGSPQCDDLLLSNGLTPIHPGKQKEKTA